MGELENPEHLDTSKLSGIYSYNSHTFQQNQNDPQPQGSLTIINKTWWFWEQDRWTIKKDIASV